MYLASTNEVTYKHGGRGGERCGGGTCVSVSAGVGPILDLVGDLLRTSNLTDSLRTYPLKVTNSFQKQPRSLSNNTFPFHSYKFT